MPNWIPTFPADRLSPGTARMHKHDATQIAVFRLEDGALHAVDNRCPHEGYPLAQGTVTGNTLTCKWHNFKFDLRDGACLLGEEAVRRYPLRVVEGVVEVDLEPPATLLDGLWADLGRAVERQETGRAARGVIRLLDLGVPTTEIAWFAAYSDALRGEYGPSHALAFGHEALTPSPGVEPALPLVQALDLAGRSILRLPVRAAPAPIDPGPEPGAAGARFRALVEAEDPAAEAMIRGAVARGWGRAELEPWLFGVCADHFLDFGHALIYSTKVFDLIEAVHGKGADTLLGSLVWGMITGTREDTLPAWAGWHKRVAALPGRPFGGAPLPADALVDADPVEAFGLAAAGDPLDALAIAAAERILRFDPAIDHDPHLAEGWLDISHRQTFVAAVRAARARWAHPDSDRLVLQAVHFVAMARPLDGPRTETSPSSSTVDAAHSAIVHKRADAVARAAGHLDALLPHLEAIVLRDAATRAIFLIHLLKNLRAAVTERQATRDDRPLLAAIRLLSSPIRERNVERTVNDAIGLVRHGRPPKALTG
jgi:nitrite reductase/ring-hydroxylating ferredoxin subunit